MYVHHIHQLVHTPYIHTPASTYIIYTSQLRTYTIYTYPSYVHTPYIHTPATYIHHIYIPQLRTYTIYTYLSYVCTPYIHTPAMFVHHIYTPQLHTYTIYTHPSYIHTPQLHMYTIYTHHTYQLHIYTHPSSTHNPTLNIELSMSFTGHAGTLRCMCSVKSTIFIKLERRHLYVYVCMFVCPLTPPRVLKMHCQTWHWYSVGHWNDGRLYNLALVLSGSLE